MEIKKLKIIFGYGCLLAILAGCQRSGDSHINASVSSLEDAQKNAPGTWTYVLPLDQGELDALYEMGRARGASVMEDESIKSMMDTGSAGWLRFIIQDGGTCERYFAFPAYSSWGKPQKCEWKVATGKYPDTGTRYYAIDVSEDRFKFNLVYNDSQHLSAGYKILTKGDAFPFSK